MSAPIAVLGAGSWGTALAAQLRRAGQEVLLWGRNPNILEAISTQSENPSFLKGIKLPAGIQTETSLEAALQKTGSWVIAVPSLAFSTLLTQAKPFWNPNIDLIWATKGLDGTTGLFLHQCVEEILGPLCQPVALSGPSFAREVATGLLTAVSIASPRTAPARRWKRRFESPAFRVVLEKDILGVQLGALCKNVYAVAAGLSDGVGFGANARAALLTQALSEMVRLGRSLGARAETFYGLSGFGDLMLSCTDDQSRNRRFGLFLGQGHSVESALKAVGQVVEAQHNVQQTYDLAVRSAIQAPLLSLVHAIVVHQEPPRRALEQLLSAITR